jgi:hypothetical protein
VPSRLTSAPSCEFQSLHHDVAFLFSPLPQPEDKQKAATAFSQLRGAMELLGISEGEQQAIWRVLAAIYHLGAAGACKGMVPPVVVCVSGFLSDLEPMLSMRTCHTDGTLSVTPTVIVVTRHIGP